MDGINKLNSYPMSFAPGRNGSLSKKLRALTRVRWIPNTFPVFARTSMKTIVGHPYNAITLVNGFHALAQLKAASITDPFNNLDVIGTDGEIDVSSFFESGGEAEMGLIYSAYKVISSTIVVKISQGVQLDPNSKSSTFVDTDGTSGSTSGTNRFHTGDLMNLVIIPSGDSVAPAVTWWEAMHHPFGYRVPIPISTVFAEGPTRTLKVTIPSHEALLNAVHRTDENQVNQAHTWTTFNTDPIDGLAVFYHCYILDAAGNSDLEHGFVYTFTMYQHVMLARVGAEGLGIEDKIAPDYAPITTG